MLDYVVKKVIAKEDERIILESSYDEMLRFTEEEIRPEFKDSDILCIKFLLSLSAEDDEVEHTKWFINPYYYNGNETDHPSSMTMDGEFVPEILLLGVPTIYIKEKYCGFHAILIREDCKLTDSEKLQRFLKEYGKSIKAYRKRHFA